MRDTSMSIFVIPNYNLMLPELTPNPNKLVKFNTFRKKTTQVQNNNLGPVIKP